MEGRPQALRTQAGTGACLVTSAENIRYLTGFSGQDSEVLVTAQSVYLFTDSRYREQAVRDVQGRAEVIITDGPGRPGAIRDVCGEGGSLGLELETLPFAAAGRFTDLLRPVRTMDISGILLQMRAVKSPEELEKIRRAAAATQQVLETVVENIRPGISEFEIRAALLYEITVRGMESAFDPVVAGGLNSAIPHAATTAYTLRKGDLLTLDFGCRCEGYCADMTRTFAVGQVDAALQTIYHIVEQAQKRGLEAARIGARADHVDAACRDWIREHGYGENFGHGTGHGVGLDIHELPVINARSQTEIAPGMVFTVEPGIYMEGLGGVRIEDTCIAGEGSLYTFPKTLLVL